MFIAAGLFAIIGAATAHTDFHPALKRNNCLRYGKASVSIILAIVHGAGLFLAAIFAYLDLNDIDEQQRAADSKKEKTENIVTGVTSDAQAVQPAYNMDSIDVQEEQVDIDVVDQLDEVELGSPITRPRQWASCFQWKKHA